MRRGARLRATTLGGGRLGRGPDAVQDGEHLRSPRPGADRPPGRGPVASSRRRVTTTYDLLGRVTEVADPDWLASGPASIGGGRRLRERPPDDGVLLPRRREKLSLPAVDAGGTPLRPYVTTTYGSLLRKTAMAVNEPKYVADLGWTFATRTSTFTYDTAYAGDTTTYTYVAGRMASAVNKTATIAFGYDQDGTPKERDEFFTGLGSNRFGASIATANDGRAVQAQFVSPYSPTVGYSLSYDSFGRPVGVVGTNSGATQVWGTTTTAVDGNGAYDALGRIADARGYVQSNGGTVTTKRTYGAYSGQLVGQVTKLGVTALYSVGSMGYVGEKLTQMTDTGTGTAYGWAYDTGGRLVTATATANTSSGLTQNYSHSFGFTPVWNLSTANVSWNGSSTSPQGYTYSGTDQATQAPGGYQPVYALTHDGMGNVVERRVPPSQIPAETLTYTAEGYLKSIVRGASTDEVLYYDALGNLAYRRSGNYLWFYVGEHATITATTTCTTDPCAPTAGTLKVNVHVLLAGARIATVRTTQARRPTRRSGTSSTTTATGRGAWWRRRQRAASSVRSTGTGRTASSTSTQGVRPRPARTSGTRGGSDSPAGSSTSGHVFTIRPTGDSCRPTSSIPSGTPIPMATRRTTWIPVGGQEFRMAAHHSLHNSRARTPEPASQVVGRMTRPCVEGQTTTSAMSRRQSPTTPLLSVPGRRCSNSRWTRPTSPTYSGQHRA